jgi:hypothetical protein
MALETAPSMAYNILMDKPMDRAPPAAWMESLDRSDAEIAAGLTVPLAEILDELRASAERLEARLRERGMSPTRRGTAQKD